MKNNTNKYITLCLILILVSCKTAIVTTADKPEDIGNQVHEIVKQIPTSTQDKFQTYFLKIEELRTFVNKPEMKINQKAKNKITSWPKDEYYADIVKKYDKIKESASSHEIDLSRITLEDFTYKVKEENGLKFCEGVLHFSYKKVSYTIEGTSIYTQNGYELFRIGKLNKKMARPIW